MKKADKTFFVQDLTEKLKTSSSVVLVDYTGLNVKSQQDLKKRLKEVGATMVVVKNTLFKLAGESAKIPAESYSDTVLEGPIALIITEADPIAPIQVIGKFAKENELPQFKIGVVEGNIQDKSALIKLSTLPGKDVLFAQAVGAISAPLYSLVGTLNGNLQKLVYILERKSGRA